MVGAMGGEQRWSTISNELKNNHCYEPDVTFSTTNETHPLICRKNPSLYSNDEPLGVSWPMRLKQNYFAKLTMDMFSRWNAAGLENCWFKNRQYHENKENTYKNVSMPRIEQKSSAVMEFHPVKLESITENIGVVYVLSGFTISVCLMELLVMLPRYSCECLYLNTETY